MDYITLLNSRQALEDLASFRMNMTTKYNMTDTNRWIAFGGSYPGALAAWLRMKYPSIVYGSVASSAPIQAKFDFYEYFEVVSASLEQARNGKRERVREGEREGERERERERERGREGGRDREMGGGWEGRTIYGEIMLNIVRL